MATQAEIDEIERGHIARARGFITSLFMGHGAWVKEQHSTLAEAVKAAETMNAEFGAESGGRRAMIFAIGRKGQETFIAPRLYPTPSEETNPMTTTYSNRSNAARAAAKAGYTKDAVTFEELRPTMAGAETRWTFTPINSGSPATTPPAPTAEPQPERPSVHIDDLHACEHPAAKANAESWSDIPATKKAREGKARGGRPAKAESKTDRLRALLSRPEGASKAEMLEACKGGHHDWDWPTILHGYVNWFKTPKGGNLNVAKEGEDTETARWYIRENAGTGQLTQINEAPGKMLN